MRAASAALAPPAAHDGSRLEAITLKGGAAQLADPSLVAALAQVAPRTLSLYMTGPGAVELPPAGARTAPSVSSLVVQGDGTTVRFFPDRAVQQQDGVAAQTKGLPGWLPALLMFFVSGTTLTTLEDSGLGACSQLTWLAALDNKLRSVPTKELATLTKLRVLDLSYNDLTAVEPLRLPQVGLWRVYHTPSRKCEPCPFRLIVTRVTWPTPAIPCPHSLLFVFLLCTSFQSPLTPLPPPPAAGLLD